MKQKTSGSTSQYRLLSDEELVYRYAKRSDEAAMHMLYERYSHLVLGICIQCLQNLSLAKTTTDQIFIQLLQDLPRFEIPNFKLWLLQVCRNQCLIQLRKEGRAEQTALAIHPFAFETEISALSVEALDEEAFSNSFSQLNGEVQQCIRLFYEERKNYAEISGITGLFIPEIKINIQQGKTILSQQLSQFSKAIT